MEYSVHSYTTKSKLHKNNEDNHFICDDYLIIADGMGGECDGDIASRIAVESIVSILSKDITKVSSDSDIKDISNKAIYKADSNISEYIDGHPDSFGMGTTVLLAIRKNDSLYISWCGDSHCYFYKNGKLNSITKDHSYVQDLIDSGIISIEESYAHPDNNLITRYVGGGKDTCIPDFCSHKISGSEIVILCSDGLSGYCQTKDIENMIAINRDLAKLPLELLNFATQQGSDDDITIVVLYPNTYSLVKKGNKIFKWLKNVMHVHRL